MTSGAAEGSVEGKVGADAERQVARVPFLPPDPMAPGAARWPARLLRLLPALRAVGFVAAVAVIVAMAMRAVREVDASQLSWWPLPLALAAAVTWWLLAARAWSIVAAGRMRRSDVSMWCRTQALRYLPGGIWAPASRAALIRGSWLDRLSTVAAENVVALCAALTVAGIALAADADFWWLPLVLAAGVPLVAARLLGTRTRVAPDRAVGATLSYLGAFGAYSLCAVLVQAAISGVDEPLAVAGAAALAWAAGFVVVFTPSGVGVREVVYVAMLSAAFPTGELAAAAVTLRVVTVLAELGVLLVAGRPTSDASVTAAAEAGTTAR